MIWFYPLNELDITGYEAFAAVWLIPIITAIPLIRRFLSTFLGILLLEIIMAFGIASFQMVGAENPVDVWRKKSSSIGSPQVKTGGFSVFLSYK